MNKQEIWYGQTDGQFSNLIAEEDKLTIFEEDNTIIVKGEVECHALSMMLECLIGIGYEISTFNKYEVGMYIFIVRKLEGYHE